MHAHDDEHDDFGGLHRDLISTGSVVDRREIFRIAARYGLGFSALSLLGCSAADAGAITGAGNTDVTTGGTAGTCTVVPEETAGPYPGDSSNGPNVLNQTGIVRQDIRSSFAGLSGTAAGIPLVIQLTVVSATTCSPLANHAIYIWHCDRAGLYSLYSAGATNQNYLRGVQPTDANGKATFTSIYPACYSGRWPHIHFEVYPSLTAATSVANKQATSQIALPKSASDLVYATAGYDQSIRNLSQITLATDMVFSDGSALELGTVTGDVNAGMTVALTVAVKGA